MEVNDWYYKCIVDFDIKSLPSLHSHSSQHLHFSKLVLVGLFLLAPNELANPFAVVGQVFESSPTQAEGKNSLV